MSGMISRRDWLRQGVKNVVGGVSIAALLSRVARGGVVVPVMTVYKDPSCGCCAKWIDHLTANGFKPIVRDRKDMDAFKDSVAVPAAMRSCHTAVYGRYWIEGHVPASDIKALMTKEPKGVLGLAVPGMPVGSPGMESGNRVDKYNVMLVAAGGKTSVFASHG